MSEAGVSIECDLDKIRKLNEAIEEEARVTRRVRERKREAARDAASDAIKDRLRSFIERIETLANERKGVSDDITAVFAEAKADGFDTPTMRAIIRLRKKSKEERQEQEALLETYLLALGMI